MLDVCTTDASYQGAPGAYSEVAARALLGAGASLLPRPTLAGMFDAVTRGHAEYAVVPVENCLTGAVPDAYELLFAHDLRAIGETRVHVDHVLIAPSGTPIERVKRVLSHPVALAQCQQFFSAHPGIEPVPVFDTAGAVEIVIRQSDGRSAALASRRSAAIYGGEIIAEHFQDHAENWTRFLLAARESREAEASGERKALLTFGLPHTPGALHLALAPIASHGLNLTRIQSQPVHGHPFEYRFIVETTAGSRDALSAALDEMRDVTRDLRLFGDYPLPAASSPA